MKWRRCTPESVKVITVELGQQTGELSSLVMEGSGPNLLGGDFLNKMRLDRDKLFKIMGNQVSETEGKPERLISCIQKCSKRAWDRLQTQRLRFLQKGVPS